MPLLHPLFVRFTQGYNPKPRVEFASPLSLGVTSEAEIVRVELLNPLEEREMVRRLNAAFPMGMRALRALRLPGTASGKKRPSLMSLFWGSDYEVTALPSPRTGQTGDQTVDLMDRLYRALEQRRREDEAASISHPIRRLSRGGDRIVVRWKRIERKGQGIMRLTAELIGMHPLEAGLCIHRTSVLASAADGSPVSYFDRMA